MLPNSAKTQPTTTIQKNLDTFAIDLEEIEEEKGRSSFVMKNLLPNLKNITASREKCEALGIDEETRKLLKDAEYYHYLVI